MKAGFLTSTAVGSSKEVGVGIFGAGGCVTIWVAGGTVGYEGAELIGCVFKDGPTVRGENLAPLPSAAR